MSEVLEAEFDGVKPEEAVPLEVSAEAILEAIPGGLIAIEQLGMYGFDQEIMDGMIRYEIFPPVFVVNGTDYVSGAEVFQVVRQLLRNSIRLYEAVDESEKRTAEAKELLESGAVKLKESDFQRMEAGEITLTELIQEKKAAQDAQV
jgi:hypothetical protein